LNFIVSPRAIVKFPPQEIEEILFVNRDFTAQGYPRSKKSPCPSYPFSLVPQVYTLPFEFMTAPKESPRDSLTHFPLTVFII